MKKLRRIALLLVLMTFVGIGASITLKIAIGVAAWDAMAQSVAFMTGIKVGTIGMLFNSSCVLGQILLLKKNFKWIQLLQIPVNIVLGAIINFFLYDVLGPLTIDSYIVKLLLLLAAQVLIALAVSAVMVLDMVTFALEGFCMAISKVTNRDFSKIRQGADVLSILVALILTFGFSLPLTLREGAIIGMLIFAPLMGFFMKKLRPLFKKWNLLEEEPVLKAHKKKKKQLA